MDKHIPIPLCKRTSGLKARDKYGFTTMDIGDSFFSTTLQSTMSGTSNYYANRLGTTYTVRKVTENGIHGVRVWRIK